MTRALVGLAAILTSVAAHAKAPPYDFARETVWARSIGGAQLQGIRLRSPFAKLLGWVPGRGQVVDVYLFTPGYDCLRVALERRAAARDPTSADRLDGTLYSPLPPFKGKAARYLLGVSVGEVLEIENEGGLEQQNADGSWHSVNTGTVGREPTTYGALSSVEGRVARFDGQPLAIDIACLGPLDHLLCATGSERICNRCEQLGLEIRETGDYDNHRSNSQQGPGLARAAAAASRAPRSRVRDLRASRPGKLASRRGSPVAHAQSMSRVSTAAAPTAFASTSRAAPPSTKRVTANDRPSSDQRVQIRKAVDVQGIHGSPSGIGNVVSTK